MRILQVLDKPPQGGGVAVHVADLSARLRSRGHEVETLRVHDPRGEPPAVSPGDSLRLPWTYGPLTTLRHGAGLVRQLQGFAPTLVHVHGAFSVFSAGSLRRAAAAAPLVGTLHDTRAFCFHMTRRFVPTGEPCERRCGAGCLASGCVRPRDMVDSVRQARRWWVDRANLQHWATLDRIVVPSAYLGQLAVQHGLPAERLRIVPHGTRMTDGDGGEPAGAAAHRPPVIAFLGSLVDYKGVRELVQALALLGDRPWQAVLAGDGPLAAELPHLLAAAGLSDRVRLPGWLADRAAVDGLLQGARLLVLPSVVPESFGLVGIEALAVGTPVVSFGLGGVQEWLHDGEEGLVARPLDVVDLARQIGRLLDDAPLAAQLGCCGRQRVRERFEAEQAFERLLAVYQELLEGPG
jgi:glycosyltransferase involved in cell wall biosynthesis